MVKFLCVTQKCDCSYVGVDLLFDQCRSLEAIKHWITKKGSLITDRFSDAFILESVKFVLVNNNFLFDNVMYK